MRASWVPNVREHLRSVSWSGQSHATSMWEWADAVESGRGGAIDGSQRGLENLARLPRGLEHFVIGQLEVEDGAELAQGLVRSP